MNLLFEGFRQYYKRLEEELDTNVEMSNEYDSEGNQLTKAQAEFFKNSKVRDTKGRLLVLYHGTGSEFDEFDPETSWDNFGFHFGTKEAASQRNSSILMRVYLNCKNVFHIKEDSQDTFYNTQKMLLSLCHKSN